MISPCSPKITIEWHIQWAHVRMLFGTMNTHVYDCRTSSNDSLYKSKKKKIVTKNSWKWIGDKFFRKTTAVINNFISWGSPSSSLKKYSRLKKKQTQTFERFGSHCVQYDTKCQNKTTAKYNNKNNNTKPLTMNIIKRNKDIR